MNLSSTLCILTLLSSLPRINTPVHGGEVRTGLDAVVEEESSVLENKRIGVIANHSSVTSDGEWILGALSRVKGLKVEILFTPEHGLDLLDGETQKRWKHIPIVNLHGRKRRPDVELLCGLDAVVFDIQDVGCRFYTYISTMLLAMDASAEAGVEFIVLDRPNPLGGEIVEGPVLKPDFRSFVGMYPVPVRYGLTAGELALMANSEGYLLSGSEVNLRVVKLRNWRRSMYFDETGLPWVAPSPNLPDMESSVLYPGLCLLEGTNISEGRGTPLPFRLVGAPWLPIDQLFEYLGMAGDQGISLAETTYTPISLPGRCENPKYENSALSGLRISVIDRKTLRPFEFAVSLIRKTAELAPEKFVWTGEYYIDRLTGTDEFRKAVDAGTDLSPLLQEWEEEAAHFQEKSKHYYLYEN